MSDNNPQKSSHPSEHIEAKTKFKVEDIKVAPHIGEESKRQLTSAAFVLKKD